MSVDLIRACRAERLDIETYSIHGDYFRRFYLPMLGPTATVLARRLAEELPPKPATFLLSLDDVADRLGIRELRTRGQSKVERALARLVAFGVTDAGVDDIGPIVSIRTMVRALSWPQVTRLPKTIADEHYRYRKCVLCGRPAPGNGRLYLPAMRHAGSVADERLCSACEVDLDEQVG